MIRRHPHEVGLALLVLLTHAYFFNGTGYNQNVRLDNIFAFVEPGPDQYSFRIDRFIVDPERGLNTGDWSFHDGHYYSSKPPGTTLLGVPLYYLLYHLEVRLGVVATGFAAAYFNTWLLGVWIGPFWTGVAAAFLLAFARRRRPDRPVHGLIVALVFAFGTWIFPYGSQIWGHTPAAAFVLMAATLVLGGRPGPRAALAAGFLAGVAVLMDYLALVPVAALGLGLLADRQARRPLALFVSGGLPCLGLLLAYHAVCFGSPWTPASALSNPKFHEPGLLGGQFGSVSPVVMTKLLFSLEHGLFAFMPALAFAPLGAVLLWRRGERQLVAVCAAAALGVLVLVSSYNVWHGGVAVGARQLIVSLPFWALLWTGLCDLPTRGTAGRGAYGLFLALALVSVCNMLVIDAVTTWVPPGTVNPLYGVLYPMFLGGEISGLDFRSPIRLFENLSPEQARIASCWNLGELLGLRSLASLVPVVAILAAGAGALLRSAWRESAAQARP